MNLNYGGKVEYDAALEDKIVRAARAFARYNWGTFAAHSVRVVFEHDTWYVTMDTDEQSGDELTFAVTEIEMDKRKTYPIRGWYYGFEFEDI